jgi:predicted nuclease of predicted toxin-antitoxin system
MRFLADENCDRLLVHRLRQLGHDVLYAMETMQGTPDIELFRLAHEEDRVLITDDLDFAHISKIETERPPAVVLVRLAPLRRTTIIERVTSALSALAETIVGQVVIIEPAQVRLRAFKAL